MSGFSPDWLDLREPADRQARCKALQAQVATYFADRDSISICDLGAGTGATVRALHPLLPRPQTWRLIDHVAENLQAAEARLGPVAETEALTIHYQVHDLADDPAQQEILAKLSAALDQRIRQYQDSLSLAPSGLMV